MHLHDHLTNFEALAHSIAQHSTHFSEIVLDYPSVIGSVDAAKLGMGGVLFAPGQPPAMWWATFLEDIQCCIILMANPTGDLMNSNLEQARVLAHADVVTLLFNLRELTLTSLNNNVGAVTQNCKGAIAYLRPSCCLLVPPL